jgi:hypothetical protein
VKKDAEPAEIRNGYLLNANADLYSYNYQLGDKEEGEEGRRGNALLP